VVLLQSGAFSARVKEALDHLLCRPEPSGHRNEAMALLQPSAPLEWEILGVALGQPKHMSL
jgi:hypothetical protein